MGQSGWSYPAGCSGLPDEMPCGICGGDIWDCLRPLCQEYARLRVRVEKQRKAEAEREAEREAEDHAAWERAAIESDEAYQEDHRIEVDPDEVPYDEYEDSVYHREDR